MNDIRKLAFIGGGSMASALVGGLVRQGMDPARITVADPRAELLNGLAADFGVLTTTDNAVAVADADVVVLAVKPQQMREVAVHLSPYLTRSPPLVVSIAAGISHATLSRWIGAHVPAVRTMPNRPALDGAGATGLYAPESVGVAHRALAHRIMAAVGTAVWVTHESQMDTVTALSGSGPAYFFLFMEALEAAAVERGLPNDVARQLTLATAYGSARMARESVASLSVLREQVTSTGGTTAAALAVLDAAGLRAMVALAVGAAARRSAELAAEYGTL